MEKITILAPAKINLFLDVGARRDDGYHDIETVMQTVTLFDRLEISKEDPNGIPEIQVRCRDFMAPDGAGNIVFRAAEAFFAATGIADYRVSFLVEKKIPSEAGLGGGSSDAAAALIALDKLYATALPTEELCQIGATVGADVPFCLKKGTALACGIGELLTSCTPMPDCAIVIAIPNGSRIGTAEAYGKIDSVQSTAPYCCEDVVAAMATCDLDRIASIMFNKFELVTPEESGAAALVYKLLSLGAIGARMSGSGPAVFGLFHDIASARAAKDGLDDSITAFVCSPARRDYPYIES